jgi:DNA-binding transcriptional LysR family regulator
LHVRWIAARMATLALIYFAKNHTAAMFTLTAIDVICDASPALPDDFPMLHNLSDLDLRLLRVFLSVVDANGISAAQATLNVSQSTISAQLATLEARLGFRLCERGRAGFRLTPKGAQFAHASRQLMERITNFCLDARQMERKLVGSLSIGMIGHAAISANARLSNAIARFRARDEAVTLSIRILSPGMLEEELINGRLNVGIGYFWHRIAGLKYAPLYTERQVAYCGRGHPLFARGDNLTREQLAKWDWVHRSYPVPEAAFPENYGGSGQARAVADNMEAVAVLILSGCHLGFLPQHFAAPLVQQGLLAELNGGRLSYDVGLQMATRRQSGSDEVLQAFLDDLTGAHESLE